MHKRLHKQLRLCLPALLLSCAFLGTYAAAQTQPQAQAVMVAQAVSEMRSDEARRAAAAKELLVFDIRTPEEWKLTGVADVAITNSMHVEGFLERLAVATGGNKDQPIGLICATGGRSGPLSSFLTDQGYSNIVNISDGMLGSPAGPGWLRNELPVRQPDEPRVDE